MNIRTRVLNVLSRDEHLTIGDVTARLNDMYSPDQVGMCLRALRRSGMVSLRANRGFCLHTSDYYTETKKARLRSLTFEEYHKKFPHVLQTIKLIVESLRGNKVRKLGYTTLRNYMYVHLLMYHPPAASGFNLHYDEYRQFIKDNHPYTWRMLSDVKKKR